MDPYTGASRYSGAPQPSAALTPLAPSILPVLKFVTFKQANVTAMQAKLYQFDEALRNEISAYSLAMYPDELRAVDEAFSYLSQAVAGKASSNKVTPAHVEALIQILNRWPSSQRFPVIDLCRLVTGYCPDAFALPGLKERFFEALFTASDWAASWSVPLSKPKETNILLLFRTLANVFQEGTTINDGAWVQQIFDRLSEAPYLSLTKAQRVTLATILFNFSCLSLTAVVEPGVRGQHLDLILRVCIIDSRVHLELKLSCESRSYSPKPPIRRLCIEVS
jgi:phospholipase A-2-activating protein